jgi:formate dehydrogenase subunit delta
MTNDTHHPVDGKARLIRMASEIADYFHAYPLDKAAGSIASHINQFWTPKMREDFLAAANEPGQRLAPQLLAARDSIKRKKIK